MKRFAGTFMVVLVALEAFIALGGYMVLDFSRNPYGTGVIWALIIAIVTHALITQQEAIDDLKKQVQELRKEKE